MAMEVEDICDSLMIPNVLFEDVPKYVVKEAVVFHNCKEIQTEMDRKENLDQICHEDFAQTKEYMKNKSIEECRVQFRIRTNMLQLKGNMKGSFKEDLSCLGCKQPGTLENQTHVMTCSGYENLRSGLNFDEDRDLVTYFQRVMRSREGLRNIV